MSDLSKGMRVRHRKGGPEMEILSVNAEVALCEWNSDGKLELGIFELEELEPVASVIQQTGRRLAGRRVD